MRDTITTEFAAKCAASACRGCGFAGIAAVLDYGQMPPSDGFLASPETLAPSTSPRQAPGSYPLELAFCEQCGLLQILETLDPRHLFGADYLYLSSGSDSWLEHCKDNALDIISRFGLDAGSLVLETASNDGYLLQYFKQHGIPVLGVDPAPEPVRHAAERGIETIHAFFTRDLARSLAQTRSADVVISNNVLAHVADIHDFIDGVGEVLSKDGCWIIEVPYVKALVDGCAYDTVYHEHLCYFSVTALQHVLSLHRLFINDLKPLESHGGSLRLYVSRRQQQSEQVTETLGSERRDGMQELAYYLAFASSARTANRQLAGLLEDLAAQGRHIAAYAAAAKGTVLLNCLGGAARHVEYAVDRNTLKQGKWIPGVNIPIISTAEIKTRQPDYLLLLAWNLRREILLQESAWLRSGGKFIVPLPAPHILSGDDL